MEELPIDHKKDQYKESLYWVQDYLARRPHSEKELLEKLKKKGFDAETSRKAIDFAKDSGWIEDPHELSCKVYKEWDKKNKSHSWIVNYLYEKGLPQDIEKDSARECEKAYFLLKKRFVKIDSENYNKAASGLSSKGFTYEDFSKASDLIKAENE